MKIMKIIELIWTILLMVFIIKGIASDYGFAPQYRPEMIYQFAYLSFAMSGFMLFDKYIFKSEGKKTSD